MWVDIYEANDYGEEAQVVTQVNLTVNDLLRLIKQGDVLATQWLSTRSYDADFRVIVQGRRVGAGKGNEIIDLRDGSQPLIVVPGYNNRGGGRS